MSKPEWKDAPEWAGVLVHQPLGIGHNFAYAWAHSFKEGAHAKRCDYPESQHFGLLVDYWGFVESRP